MSDTMADVEELTKQVDLVYKNLLDKFNPAARQLITAGKAYLKALHGAMAASKVYLDALTKVARHSQQGLWGGSSDIGMCLMQMVDVYKEVQSQQMTILKAFYVDLIVPLETNLDKDTKVLQTEQKKFLSSHKHRLESYTKAASQVKKHKKKNRANKGAMDKEIKQFQAMEEEKCKMDGFIEQSLQNAVTQERRRYGFILERQCSLAKHYLAYHGKGSSLLQHTLDKWQEVSKTRETLPDRIQCMLPTSRPRDTEGIYSTPLCLDDDAMSVTSQMRKARSVDASCLDLSSIADEMPSRPITRARSEFNLDHRSTPDTLMHRRSMAVPEDSSRRAMARALYPYSPSGDNQLSFVEMDLIALIGEKNKGWQYGENLRTQRCGWFPVAYTELLHEEDDSALGSTMTSQLNSRGSVEDPQATPAGAEEPPTGPGLSQHAHAQPYHRFPPKHRPSIASMTQVRAASPAAASHASASTSASSVPVPQSSSSAKSSHVASSQETLRTCTSMSSSVNTVLFNHAILEPPSARVSAPTIKKSTSQPQPHAKSGSNPFTSSGSLTTGSSMTLSRSFTTGAGSSHLSTRFQKRGSGNASFHSSDDSGFSNESGSIRPPMNPEADYSDDDLNGPESCHSSDQQSFQYIAGDQDATMTLPTPGRKHKSDSVKHRDLSLPSLSIDHFVTLARRKTNRSSPCAQKIAAQRERGRSQERGRRTVRRSSSLLCLGMDSCRGIPDDLQSADYEDVWSEDWRHSSLVDVSIDIPDPPSFQPPAPPTPASTRPTVDYSIRPPMPLPHDDPNPSPRSCSNTRQSESSQQNSNSSSGNSTLTGSDEEDNEEEIYMVVSDHRCEMRKTQMRKQVSRSLTWASPAHRRSPPPPPLPMSNPPSSAASSTSTKITQIRRSHASPRRPDESQQQSSLPHSTLPSQATETPPLPPRRTQRPPCPLPKESRRQSVDRLLLPWQYGSEVNILNYSDYMNRRLKYPEGVSRIDQQSYTTGNLCGPWYDLWADDPSVADV
ncbi:uncharacterized protein LOC134775688 isoform X3 [Penaeus indicus]|uniref:uncharacterized protein LOC134775688 isoform X3 n=1 Tax=Penaeus indicus TaxID=29960 RepID=UPI00300CDB29